MVMGALLSWLHSCPSPKFLFVVVICFEVALFVFIRSSPYRAKTNRAPSRGPKGAKPPPSSSTAAPGFAGLDGFASSSPSPVEAPLLLVATESAKLQQLKARIPSGDALATNDILSRMLSAREGDVSAAVAMYGRWVDFRQLYSLDSIEAADVQGLIDCDIAHWHGTDKCQRPVVVIMPRKYFPDQHTSRCVIQFAMYLMKLGVGKADELKANDPSLSGEICVLYDRRGFTKKNFDPNLFGVMKKVVDIIQKTRSKIVLLSDDPRDLLLFFDEAQLEEERLKAYT